MRTPKEILIEHLGEDLYHELAQEMIYPQPSGKFPITDLLISAIEDAVYEATSGKKLSNL